MLKFFLVKLNTYLLKKRKQNYETNFYWGILLPFFRIKNPLSYSNLLVRIIEEEFYCFNTKTKVPYLIFIETVR